MNRATVATAILSATMASGVLLAQRPAPNVELTELKSIPAELQAAAIVDPEWTPPRTSWGHPSIEGMWSTDMRRIPRDRAAELGTQEYLRDSRHPARRARAPAREHTCTSTPATKATARYAVGSPESALTSARSRRPSPRGVPRGTSVYGPPPEDAEIFDINRGE